MLWLCRFLIGSASSFGIHSIPVARSQQENTCATEVRGIRPSDNRRVSNEDQVSRVAALAMKRGKSVDFTGYWQRHFQGT
jgi:hypothetical protein